MVSKLEHQETVPVAEQETGARSSEPGPQVLAAAIGNRAFTELIRTGAAPAGMGSGLARSVAGIEPPRTGARVLARDFEVPPAPVTLDAPAEREKEAFPEADKERARKNLIGPLRAAAAQLGAGEKSDVASVLRHLRPTRAATAGVKWPESLRDQAFAAIDELEPVKVLLESLKLDHRQAVTRARQRWATARQELKLATKAIKDARPDSAKNPDAKEREGATEDANAILALSLQIDATSQDLAKAPRTQEGFKAVADTAADLVGQFDTIHPPEATNDVERAKDSVVEGLATIVPLAEGKAEAIAEAQKEIAEVANKLAGLVGDAPPEAAEPDEKHDDDPAPAHFDPPPSPHALPPPPPPPIKTP